MKIIEEALQPITGFLISITRNTVEGWYEIEIGLPSTWVFDGNDEISCEVLKQSDAGKLIKIAPKTLNIELDDLVDFVSIIIQTNERIAEKEKQFTAEMDAMKSVLENKARDYFKDLDELKINSFKNLNDNFVKNLRSEDEKKPRKPRAKNEPKATSGETETNIETESKVE